MVGWMKIKVERSWMRQVIREIKRLNKYPIRQNHNTTSLDEGAMEIPCNREWILLETGVNKVSFSCFSGFCYSTLAKYRAFQRFCQAFSWILKEHKTPGRTSMNRTVCRYQYHKLQLKLGLSKINNIPYGWRLLSALINTNLLLGESKAPILSPAVLSSKT